METNTQLQITKDHQTGLIYYNRQGTAYDIGKLIAETMHKDLEFCAIVLGAIPTAVDLIGMNREELCKQIMLSKGNR